MHTASTRSFILKGVILILFSFYVVLVFGQARWQINTTLITPAKISPQSWLRYFKGAAVEKKVVLQWALDKENELSTIIVEKRSSNEQFVPIAQFWVNFDGDKSTDFHYKDKDGNNLTQYYRLKLIDNNGRSEYSNVIIVKNDIDNELNAPSLNSSFDNEEEEVWVTARAIVIVKQHA
jgi:hypothetical protein